MSIKAFAKLIPEYDGYPDEAIIRIECSVRELRALAAQPQGEPVAWLHHCSDNDDKMFDAVDFNKNHPLSVHNGDRPLTFMDAPRPGRVSVPRDRQSYEKEFNVWLRSVCFQSPPPAAYDLALCAWQEASHRAAAQEGK